MRYLLELAYDGTNYHGWQVQPNANTVQAEVNKALSTVLREEITTLGSGRTDTGVHAEQQFVHFDTEQQLTDKVIQQLNGVSPNDLAFYTIKEVSADFNVRFDAISRAYRYRIESAKNPFLLNQYYRYHKPVNVEAMSQAAKILLEHTDFECFSKVHTEVKTFQCTIMQAEWKQEENKLEFYIKANRFLRGMVRAIVGTLLEVGLGKISEQQFREIIESKNRNNAGRAVPAEGLYLVEVNY